MAYYNPHVAFYVRATKTDPAAEGPLIYECKRTHDLMAGYSEMQLMGLVEQLEIRLHELIEANPPEGS